MGNLDKIDICIGDLSYVVFDWLQLKCIVLEDDEKDYVTVGYEIDTNHDTGESFISRLVVDGQILTDGEVFESLTGTVELNLAALASDLNEYS